MNTNSQLSMSIQKQYIYYHMMCEGVNTRKLTNIPSVEYHLQDDPLSKFLLSLVIITHTRANWD